jgi:hypothetical protein
MDICEIEKFYVVSHVILPTTESEKNVWLSDCHGLFWFESVLHRVQAVASLFESLIGDAKECERVTDAVKTVLTCNALPYDNFRFEGMKALIKEASAASVNFDSVQQLTDVVINRLHQLGLRFPKFRECDENSIGKWSLQLENTDLLDINGMRDVQSVSERIPGCVLYTERLDAILKKPDIADNEYEKWKEETTRRLIVSRKERGSTVERMLKTIVYDGVKIRAKNEKMLISEEIILHALTQYLVPWDDYDENCVKDMNDEEASAYRFSRVYACYTILRSCFQFPDELVTVITESQKLSRAGRRRKNKNAITSSKMTVDSYMYSRFFSGIVEAHRKLNVPSLPPIGDIVQPVPRIRSSTTESSTRQSSYKITKYCDDLRRNLHMPDNDVKLVKDMGGKTPEEVRKALAARRRWREQVNEALIIIKPEIEDEVGEHGVEDDTQHTTEQQELITNNESSEGKHQCHIDVTV